MNSGLTKEWLQKVIAENELVLRDCPPFIGAHSRIELEAYKLALSAMEAAPDGWQVVPKKPTEEMEEAAFRAAGAPSDWDGLNGMWEAALAVSPKAG